MADCIIQRAGGGAGSDECTAVRAQVLAGFTAVTKDSGDEPVVGSMVNRGAVSQDLNCGGSFTVPAGYHDGAGIVRANSLASQTGGCTAEDKYVLSGKTYWKDGVKRTGGMTVSSVVSFSVAAYSTSQIIATWRNPAKGPYSAFAICGKAGGYPTSIWDSRVYTGGGTNNAAGATNTVTISGLSPGVLYYFRIWVYLTCSAGEQYSAGYAQATGAPTRNGRQAFTSSGTFTVPAGVRTIDIHCTGGGGCGGASYDRRDDEGAGGAGGYTNYSAAIAVTPGEVLSVAVGIGGQQSSYAGTLPPNTETSPYYGGTSYVSRGVARLCFALGGSCGYNPTGNGEVARQGGNGGSGGGAGCYTNRDQGGSTNAAGKGGSDGSGGRASYPGHLGDGPIDGENAGAGQNRSTREFGNPSLTLYSGGGGGGGRYPAAGGAGGGGRGGKSNSDPAIAGSAGTGGGGGGGSYVNDYDTTNAKGGSGNVIIRW